eukprot:10429250-Alexandrium_andersonii.AAC.1
MLTLVFGLWTAILLLRRPAAQPRGPSRSSLSLCLLRRQQQHTSASAGATRAPRWVRSRSP